MKYIKIKNDIENRIKTFDFHFCFEFAMRRMGRQNTTFDFQFSFEFAVRTMGHYVARCSHNRYKVKSETIFET